MDMVRIAKTILPAVVVLIAGLFGINFVYNTYLKDSTSAVAGLEPAAGEEGAAVVAPAADGTVAPAADATAIAPADAMVAPVLDECAGLDEAAKIAVGTEKAEEAAKAAADCAAAKAAKEATPVVPGMEGTAPVEPAPTEAAPAPAPAEGAAH